MPAEAIKVAVRVRPFNQREKDLKSDLVVKMYDQTTEIQPHDGGEPKKFTFDFSYWSHDPSDPNFVDQEKVMHDIGDVILENSLTGFNGCLFAYGQTGSGKSYEVSCFDPTTVSRSELQ